MRKKEFRIGSEMTATDYQTTHNRLLNMHLYSSSYNDKNKRVAQLWQRDRATHDAILRGWATLRLNFRLKGYVSRQYL